MAFAVAGTPHGDDDTSNVRVAPGCNDGPASGPVGFLVSIGDRRRRRVSEFPAGGARSLADFSVDPLAVTGVSPASGPVSGGTFVTVSGTEFQPGARQRSYTD